MTHFRRRIRSGARTVELLGGDYHCQPGCIELRVADVTKLSPSGFPTEIEVHLSAQEARGIRAALARAIRDEEADR